MFRIVRVHFHACIFFPALIIRFSFSDAAVLVCVAACSSKVCSGIGNVLADRVQSIDPSERLFSPRASVYTWFTCRSFSVMHLYLNFQFMLPQRGRWLPSCRFLCRPGTMGLFCFIFIHTMNNVPKRLYCVRSGLGYSRLSNTA